MGKHQSSFIYSYTLATASLPLPSPHLFTMQIPQLGLRAVQFVFIFLTLALVGNVIAEAFAGNLSKINYAIFVSVFDMIVILWGIGSRDRPRFTDTLDVIKFLCKDLWMLVFRKQIDNLKTNHRGVYVLTDNSFRPFARMSTEAGGQAVVRAQPFLWFPCGIIRGALASMGINATVQAETSELPGATFQIKSIVAKP